MKYGSAGDQVRKAVVYRAMAIAFALRDWVQPAELEMAGLGPAQLEREPTFLPNSSKL